MQAKIIGIGSSNPAKVKAVEAGIHDSGLAHLPVRSYDVPSGVSPQPLSDEETKAGAVNRALACVQEGADIGIGLEGGVMMMEDGMYVTNWGALAVVSGEVFTAAGARIKLPEAVTEGLQAGAELGTVMARLTKDDHVRKKEGAVGIFTAKRMTRSEMFRHIAIMLVGQYEYSTQEKPTI
ncbi:DUF84 family protein [Fictibacillus iocasae]|uniref:inosine/xanthosine triphosphatase n=1 Tax=Fictibacillus iocasae TaxID=2715437 RepID=A0ABW2NTY0_9BACL